MSDLNEKKGEKMMNVKRDTWCRHRTAFDKEQFPVCKVGVDYHQFPRPMDAMPCIGKNAAARALCPQYSGWTDEEITARDKDRHESFERIIKTRNAIVANIESTGNSTGSIQCPCCSDGCVRYSRASNGHVHAGCTTEGCVRWME